jgi:predicted phage terminase large subunit-like protein
MREKLYDWWRSTAYSRLEPGGVVIIIQTRWHEDDLAGRVLRDHEGDPDWHAVDFKAICEGEEALGRDVGAALWPSRYPIERLGEIRSELGPYWWSALYQQTPQPEGGGIFKRDWFKYCRVNGSDINLEGKTYNANELINFTVADLATSTKETADFTVVATFAVLPDGLGMVLRDLERDRIEGPDIHVVLKKHQDRYKSVYVGVETGGFQLAIVQQARRHGVKVRELKPDRDKVARALGVTPMMESGHLFFNDSAEWLADLEHELLHFPTSTHDDQVDVLGYASTMYTELTKFSITQLVGKGGDEQRREHRLKQMTAGRDGKQKSSWRTEFTEFKKQLW